MEEYGDGSGSGVTACHLRRSSINGGKGTGPDERFASFFGPHMVDTAACQKTARGREKLDGFSFSMTMIENASTALGYVAATVTR